MIWSKKALVVPPSEWPYTSSAVNLSLNVFATKYVDLHNTLCGCSKNQITLFLWKHLPINTVKLSKPFKNIHVIVTSYILQHNRKSRKSLTGGGGDNPARLVSSSHLLLTRRMTSLMEIPSSGDINGYPTHKVVRKINIDEVPWDLQNSASHQNMLVVPEATDVLWMQHVPQ